MVISFMFLTYGLFDLSVNGLLSICERGAPPFLLLILQIHLSIKNKNRQTKELLGGMDKTAGSSPG
jgi:hypothetical protein